MLASRQVPDPCIEPQSPRGDVMSEQAAALRPKEASSTMASRRTRRDIESSKGFVTMVQYGFTNQKSGAVPISVSAFLGLYTSFLGHSC